MKVIYSNHPAIKEYDPNSIFLAGPTPRDSNTPSWRPLALKYLRVYGFKGTVLYPEREDWTKLDYIDQVQWEKDCLTNCALIVFWIPRKMENMPALTTNVEFGYWLAKTPEKIRYGRPSESENNRYLDWLFHDNLPLGHIFHNLDILLITVIRELNK